MEKFQLDPAEYPLGKRIIKELSLLGLLLLILLFFGELKVVYLSAIFLMYILLLLLKRNRIIYEIKFDDDAKEIHLYYFYLIACKGLEKIPYSKIGFNMGLKRFGFGSAIETLELFKGKILAGEIRKEGKWKWSEENTKQLHEKLSQVANLK